MSILDGMPTNEAQLKAAMEFAAPILEGTIEKLGLTERQRSVIDLMKEGLSLADILGISKQHRDALLAQGCRFLQIGDIQKARDTLVMLYQMEPMDERVIYALASTFQVEGDFKNAGKLYVNFIALDATNPEGFLRLGECFLGAQEYDNAEGMFETALSQSKQAGDERNAEHAEKMLGIARERRTATAS